MLQTDKQLLDNIIRTCTFFHHHHQNQQERNDEENDNSFINTRTTIPANLIDGSGTFLKPQYLQTTTTTTAAGDLHDQQQQQQQQQQPITLFSRPAVSVSMSERKQRDIIAHCGPRTLFIAPQETTTTTSPLPSLSASCAHHDYPILARGANKFFDLQQAFHQISSLKKQTTNSTEVVDGDYHFQSCYYSLRKAAGFFCMIFSDDGKEIRCASKHSLVGDHVDVAKKAFMEELQMNNNNNNNCQHRDDDDSTTIPHNEVSIARRLFDDKLAILCECVLSSKESFGQAHPTLDDDIIGIVQDDDDKNETRTRATLFCFAVQRLDTLIEWSLPFEKISNEFPFVKVVDEISASQPNSSLSKVICDLVHRATISACPDVSSSTSSSQQLRGEGAVLLIEDRTMLKNENADDLFIRPIRVKIKSVQYQVARQLRTFINTSFSSSSSNGSSSSSSLFSNSSPLVVAILCWLFSSALSSSFSSSRLERNPETGLPIGFSSWNEVMMKFFDDDEKTNNNAEREKMKYIKSALNQDACHRHRVQHLNPKFVVLLSGLPGCGKSSLARALKRKLEEMYFNTRCDNDQEQKQQSYHENIRVDIIERDAFVPELPPGSSNHAQRSARRAAHRGFMKALRSGCTSGSNNNSDSSSSIFLPNSAHVIIIDACHASIGARQTSRECVAPYRYGITCHLHHTNRKTLVKRILSRNNHRVLSNQSADVAEKAVFDVASSFVNPSKAEEEGDEFVKFVFGKSATSGGKEEGQQQVPSLDEMTDRILNEKGLKKAIDDFYCDLAQCRGSSSSSVSENTADNNDNESQHQHRNEYYNFNDWSFFQENFLATSLSSNQQKVSSFHDLLQKCSPPPSLLTVRVIPPRGEEEVWRATIEKLMIRTLGGGGLSSSSSATVVAGHTRWIEPYFKSKKKKRSEDDTAAPVDAVDTSLADDILKRFNAGQTNIDEDITNDNDDDKNVLHVTLLHANDFARSVIPEETCQYWLREEESSCRQKMFKIKPTRIAIDRCMIAVRVEVERASADEQKLSTQKEENTKILHITYCHTSKVNPSYATELLAREQQQQEECKRESGKRRERSNETEIEEELQQSTKTMSKNQKRKSFDQQFCIFDLTATSATTTRIQEEEADEMLLYGVVECLAK